MKQAETPWLWDGTLVRHMEIAFANEELEATKEATMIWTGRILSALCIAMLVFSAVMKFAKPAPVIEGFATMGYSEALAIPLGIVEMACAVLYAIPQTSILGAILVTGYLGGATATHVRIGDPFFMPVFLGVVVWAGLWLREARLRAILPLRR